MKIKLAMMLILLVTEVSAGLLGPLLECHNKKKDFILRLQTKDKGSVHLGKKICPFEVTSKMYSPRSSEPTVNVFFEVKDKCHPKLFVPKGFLKLSIVDRKDYFGKVMVLKENQTFSCIVTESKRRKVLKQIFSSSKSER